MLHLTHHSQIMMRTTQKNLNGLITFSKTCSHQNQRSLNSARSVEILTVNTNKTIMKTSIMEFITHSSMNKSKKLRKMRKDMIQTNCFIKITIAPITLFKIHSTKQRLLALMKSFNRSQIKNLPLSCLYILNYRSNMSK